MRHIWTSLHAITGRDEANCLLNYLLKWCSRISFGWQVMASFSVLMTVPFPMPKYEATVSHPDKACAGRRPFMASLCLVIVAFISSNAYPCWVTSSLMASRGQPHGNDVRTERRHRCHLKWQWLDGPLQWTSALAGRWWRLLPLGTPPGQSGCTELIFIFQYDRAGVLPLLRPIRPCALVNCWWNCLSYVNS
jgi:hypothetical protein